MDHRNERDELGPDLVPDYMTSVKPGAFYGCRPVGKARTIVDGFIDKAGQAQGRPVGLAVDRQGALLIADDLGDTVWRVSAAGK